MHKYAREIAKLRLFNEKAKLLRRSRFVSQVFRPDFGFTMKFLSSQPLSVEKRGADEEATLALATTFRFFIQPRDGIELKQIANLYEALPVTDDEKQRVRSAVNSVEALLDSPLEFGFNGKSISKRHLLEVFMYGGLAHANDDKRAEYENWTTGDLASIMQCFFEETVAEVLRVIVSFENMNDRTIKLLESHQGQASPAVTL